MFDHKSLATDGLYPGITTTQSVANLGTFIGSLVRRVKKIITSSRRVLSMGVSATTNNIGMVSEKHHITNTAPTNSIFSEAETKTINALAETKKLGEESSAKKITGKQARRRIKL